MRVVDIYTSIQSEGWNQGYIATHVFLNGCTTDCDFCDVKDIRKFEYLSLEVNDVIATIKDVKMNRRVLITGGEPFEHSMSEMYELITKLRAEEYFVMIETNGYIKNHGCGNLNAVAHWFSVSPKPKYNYEVKIKKVHEIKVVEDESVDKTVLDRLTRNFLMSYKILQPKDNDKDSLLRCVELQRKSPKWIIRPQLNKIIGLR